MFRLTASSKNSSKEKVDKAFQAIEPGVLGGDASEGKLGSG